MILLYLHRMEHEKKKYWHSFSDCYDAGELASHGIEAIPDNCGKWTADFEYKGVTIAYQVNGCHFPVQFAMSYRIDMKKCGFLRPDDRLTPGGIEVKYGAGMDYWSQNTEGPYECRPRKYHEPPMFYADTYLPLDEFRKEMTRRILRAARLYDRKERELGLKFEIVKKQRMAKYTDECCIENFIAKELRRGDPEIFLPNGHRLVMSYAKNLAFAINEGNKKEDRVLYVLKLDPVDYEGFFIEKFTYHEFWQFDMAVRGLIDAPAE